VSIAAFHRILFRLMKKLIILLGLVSLILTGNVLAQGTVNFGTTSFAHVIQISPGSAAPAGMFTVGIYYGPQGGSSNSLVMMGTTTLNLSGGAINGGTRTTGVDVLGGATAFFQVRAWTGGYATFELAYAAALSNPSIRLGYTPVFANPTGNPSGAPPTLPANLIGWTSPIIIVPEPSTMILGTFGAVSILLLHRRRNST
jgi:hypothetical protein